MGIRIEKPGRLALVISLRADCALKATTISKEVEQEVWRVVYVLKDKAPSVFAFTLEITQELAKAVPSSVERKALTFIRDVIKALSDEGRL